MKFENDWTKEVGRLRSENKELREALLNLTWAAEIVLHGTKNSPELVWAHDEALKLIIKDNKNG